ncbi:MAG: hypothetical protein NVSMB22_06370 [Chloroflexota bacterium]
MGVINVTPDSFSGDGLYRQPSAAADRAETLVGEGADILDVGAESTRRGYRPVSTEEELLRLLPALRSIARRVSVPISVDTSKAEVARQALREGASIVNDVSGLHDPMMVSVVADASAGVILVHNGVPAPGRDVMASLIPELRRQRVMCLENGVEARRIAVDPGLGMGGKDWRTNFPIMRDLAQLKALGHPIVVGASRKGMIARVLGPGRENQLDGSLALAALCAAHGATILRVHDVKETRDVAMMIAAIQAPAMVARA